MRRWLKSSREKFLEKQLHLKQKELNNYRIKTNDLIDTMKHTIAIIDSTEQEKARDLLEKKLKEIGIEINNC